METLNRIVITFFACIALAWTVTAGPEPMSSKETKEVIPPPLPACDWSGFYFGLHVGGEFGESDNHTGDPGYNEDNEHWDYGQSGVVAGGQMGYNFQFGNFVFGPEFDLGYMNLDGSGVQPSSPGNDTSGDTESDLYFTLRGRLGVNANWNGCWLFYVTGGAIGVNYRIRQLDDCITGDCGEGLIDLQKEELDWGPTVGTGIERQIGRHWSIKLEYLYFCLDGHSVSGNAGEGGGGKSRVAVEPNTPNGGPDTIFHFHGDSEGHIVRGGLNFRF